MKELTPEQTQKLMDFWNSRPTNPPSLKEIMVHLFGEGYDGRSIEAQAVRAALSTMGLKAKTLTEYDSKTSKIEITESHQEFIKNNVATMNALDIAKVIFLNPKLTNLAAETRAVNAEIRKLNPAALFNEVDIDNVPMEEYRPPATFDEGLKRINKYIPYVVDRSKITASQKKNVDTVVGYLHTYRYQAQMSNYETIEERRICEDAFIRATYDKPDLMQEEIDQYIEYANHVVQGFSIQKRSNNLQKILDNVTGGDEPERMKIAMSFVEAIGKASTEYNLCKKREQDLLDALKQKRSARLAKQISDNASILNLVQAWRSEDTRTEMNRHADKEQASINEEVDRLSSLPDFKARILGLNKEGIRNG